MIKFNLFKRSTYTAPRRLSYHAARKRREALTRKVKFMSWATAAVAVGLAMLYITPDGQKRADTGRSPVTLPLLRSVDASNPLSGKELYVDPQSNAARQAKIWQNSDANKALVMNKLADQPGARWFSNRITFDEVHGYISAAHDDGKIPVTVAYYLPKRDCNKYSTGGAANEAMYYDYIDTYAKAIGSMEAIIILEPDALVHTLSKDPQGQDCLDDNERQMYFTLLTYAVGRFKSLPATTLYIDAGNSGWTTNSDQMAELLQKADIDRADGFSLNVSNFQETPPTMQFGDAISAKTGGKHYVIDTSRNGAGPYHNSVNTDYSWCNPPGRALGHYPTTSTEAKAVDAFLYIKNIGESDGTDPDFNKCYGGPSAGTWWPEYAMGLVERWPANLQYQPKP